MGLYVLNIEYSWTYYRHYAVQEVCNTVIVEPLNDSRYRQHNFIKLAINSNDNEKVSVIRCFKFYET